jgi:hypothetical protein
MGKEILNPIKLGIQPDRKSCMDEEEKRERQRERSRMWYMHNKWRKKRMEDIKL